MGLMDILQGAMAGGTAGGPGGLAGLGAEFEKLRQGASGEQMGAGLADAMRSDQTPPFGDFVGQLFGKSSPGQQAGVLNQILAALGPAALSGVAGGVLGRILSPGQTQLTPEQASQVSPQDAAEIAAHAEKTNPGIVDQVAQFYGQNSTLINSLGMAALAFTMNRVKENQRKA